MDGNAGFVRRGPHWLNAPGLETLQAQDDLRNSRIRPPREGRMPNIPIWKEYDPNRLNTPS